MPVAEPDIPERFLAAYHSIQQLAQHERYLAAFIFGSLARGEAWDPHLAQLVEYFVTANDVQTKFQFWSGIIDHILVPIGGRQLIAENNCTCEACSKDLSMIHVER